MKHVTTFFRQHQVPVRIDQRESDLKFTVTYGKQVQADLTYAQAAKAFGEACFHALACGNRLDNRSPDELLADMALDALHSAQMSLPINAPITPPASS